MATQRSRTSSNERRHAAGKACNDMNASNERTDPDSRVHAAWLGHLSGTVEGLLGKQASEQRVLEHQENGTAGPTNCLDTPIRLDGPDVALRQLSRLGRRSGVIIIALIALAFAIALAALVMPRHLWLSESSRQPKLIAQPSHGISGEPAPLGLALRGSADDAVVIVRGLMPGTELSAGRPLADGAWQLAATDLPYAWVAPPPGFVGSADLLAELQLPNSKIVDRQSIYVEWTPPAASTEPEREREQTRRGQETESVPPIVPATVQEARERSIINTTPPILPPSSQEQAGKQERGKKSAGAHGKKNSRGAAREDSRAQPFERLTVGDGTHSPKGFWDWSR
jgi:hypothetical protein